MSCNLDECRTTEPDGLAQGTRRSRGRSALPARPRPGTAAGPCGPTQGSPAGPGLSESDSANPRRSDGLTRRERLRHGASDARPSQGVFTSESRQPAPRGARRSRGRPRVIRVSSSESIFLIPLIWMTHPSRSIRVAADIRVCISCVYLSESAHPSLRGQRVGAWTPCGGGRKRGGGLLRAGGTGAWERQGARGTGLLRRRRAVSSSGGGPQRQQARRPDCDALRRCDAG